MVPQLVKKFPEFYHTLMFINKFTRSHCFFNVQCVCYNFIFINLKYTKIHDSSWTIPNMYLGATYIYNMYIS